MSLLTYPLPAAGYFGGLRVASCTFDLGEALEISRTGAGEVLTADLGPRLWTGQVTLAQARARTAHATHAVLQTLRQAGRSLMVFDPAHACPAADPEGAILAAAGAAPVIAALPAGNRSLQLEGLPAGYGLSPGDYLSFAYGAAPERVAFHQIVQGAVADVAGVTGEIEVIPHIRPGAVLGAPVQLVRPAFKAVIKPSSVQLGASAPGLVGPTSFEILQTLR